MQQREQHSGTQGAYQRKQQRPPKIPAQALIEGVQQEGDGAPGGCRRFEAEPANDTRAVKDKVDTERDHNDEVDEVPEQPAQERKQPGEGAQRLSKQLVLELGNLVCANAQLSQPAKERLRLTRSRRAQQEVEGLRERGCLPNEGGGDDKQDHSQDTCYQQIGNGDCQRPWEAALEKQHKRIVEVSEQCGKQQEYDRRDDQ